VDEGEKIADFLFNEAVDHARSTWMMRNRADGVKKNGIPDDRDSVGWSRDNGGPSPCSGDGFRFLRFLAVFLLEALHPSGGIDELLLAGEERMALRADFHLEVAKRRAGLENISADAGDGGTLVVGMDAFFHRKSPKIRCCIA
jgi:hypothetical protein